MNGNAIKRGVVEGDASVASGGTTSGWIAAGGAVFGSFQLPSSIDGTEITIQFSNDATNATAVPEASSTENNPATVAANGTYLFPVGTFAAKFFRFVFTTAQSGGARTIHYFLKG